jgi:hypothetical protein
MKKNKNSISKMKMAAIKKIKINYPVQYKIV